MRLIFAALTVIGMFIFFVISAESNEKAKMALASTPEFSKVITSEQ